MSKTNHLHTNPPAPVATLLSRLGSVLRLARLRRGLTIANAADEIGVGVRAVREAERGSTTSTIGVTVALLSLYRLTAELERLADPSLDVEGLRLAGPKLRKRGRALKSRVPPSPIQTRPVVLTASSLELPRTVLDALPPEGLQALELLKRSGTLRTTELASALQQRPVSVNGIMRELRRTLHRLGVDGLFTDENLPSGESLFRFTGRQGA